MTTTNRPEVAPAARKRTSVAKALELLALVGQVRSLRVADAADTLGVARSTAHRLLATLEEYDFVIQDKPNGAYRPGPALNEIGTAAIADLDIRRVAQPVLHQLRDLTQETVSLAVLEGRNVRIVDCVEGLLAVHVRSRTGVILPAHSTATGRVILATRPEADLRRRYPDKEPIPAVPAPGHDPAHQHGESGWARLMSRLAEIRRVGYAISHEESEEGISAVAVALGELTDAPLASLAVVLPAQRMVDPGVPRSIAPQLLAAAEDIRRRWSKDPART